MKKVRLNFLGLSLFLLGSKGLFSQWVTIPDPQFVSYLQINYPACMSADQMDTTCVDITSVTDLDIPGFVNISNLEGVQYFDSLQTLQVVSSPLTSLPSSLYNLSKLTYLNVNTGALTSLPILPPFLESLQCGGNQITSLPDLPASLTDLNVGPNLLTSLPTLPDSLMHIWAQGNPLTSLPDLPNTLQHLWVSDCQLTSLPELPASLYSLLLDNNPNLTCVPILPDGLWETSTSSGISFPGTGITCIPNIPSAAAVTPSYPICQDGDLINNPNNCPTTSGVYGNVFKDDNVNCTFDSGDAMLQNIKLNLIDASGDTVQISTTSSNGSYHFEGMPDGDYTVNIDTADLPFISSSCPSGLMIPVTITGGLAVFEVNFSMICESGFDIGALSAVPIGWVFPGQDHTLTMHIGEIANNFGVSCAAGISGTVEISVNGPITYQGYAAGALAPTSIAGNVFTYDVLDFGSIDFFNDFGLVFTTDTTAIVDDTVCLSIEVTPLTGDANTTNNTFNFCYPVVNSYDPNIKLVYPTRVEPNYQDWLTYTIYFQNTGTAPAFNIKLTDTLSDFLMAESFQVINYSHPVVVGRFGNLLSFKFNDIMLPDSTSNPEGSIGFVQFRIKPKPGILENEMIQNKVYIYFDFNEPIITNDAITIFKSRKFFGGETLIPYPNPSNNIVQFYVPESYIGKETNVSVYNLQGEKILSYDFIPSGLISFDFSNQLPGMYILKVTSEDKKLTARFLHE